MDTNVRAARRPLTLLCVLLAALLMLTACTADATPAATRLTELLALYGTPPAGQTFASAPTAEGEKPLGSPLIAALYARADGYLEYEGRVAEAAVYLGSAAEPFFEAAVFVCYGSADARAIAEMCHRRARLVATAHTVRAEDAVITVSGRTVILIISRDVSAARRAAARLL